MPSRASTPSSTPFRGLSAFPVTPADAQGRVEAGALARLVRRLAEAGADSIGLLGSTGTYAYLSRAERRRAIEAAREAAGKVPLIVGAGALRTDEAVALASGSSPAAWFNAVSAANPPDLDELTPAVAKLLAKLTGELDERPQVQVLNVAASPEWAETRARMLHALQPFPEARQAVALALTTGGGDA